MPKLEWLEYGVGSVATGVKFIEVKEALPSCFFHMEAASELRGLSLLGSAGSEINGEWRSKKGRSGKVSGETGEATSKERAEREECGSDVIDG
eukprot:768225-Hanusia_phi.AAC.5